ncbi:recombinase family protein [Clostridium sp.]|uniref:recombinase family protein n=1 Tax=Clostridium sp. TaxID=1506 RepID=UPI003463E4BF
MRNNRRNRRKNVRLIPASRPNQKRVAIYCRVSTMRGSQEESLEAQKSGLQNMVKDNPNWTLVKVYTDTESGKNIYRPGFKNMIFDSYENQFDIILVKSISRFNRNTVDLLETVNKLRSLEIEVIFSQENVSSKDRDSDLVMALSASLAQAESESLSEAIKWGLKSGFETGESKLYNRKCFGYSQSETGELVINEEQAVVVRRIFDLYLSGYSVDMIMQELASNDIKSPTGKDNWSKRAIQKMLTNEKYIGNVMLGKTYTGPFPNTQQKVNRGTQEQYLMENAHEPIINMEIFEQVKEEMKRRSNIEIVDGKAKRKNTHYSAGELKRSRVKE